MKKNKFKVIFLVLFVLFLFFIVTNVYNVYAEDIGTVVGRAKITKPNATAASNAGNTILGAIKVVGVIVSVGALMYIGIKYMISSVEERADMKKTIPYYITGVIFIGGVLGIMKLIEIFINEVK